MAVNNSYQLAPWADALYACDGGWWRAHKGVEGFAGLRITQDRRVCTQWPDIKPVRCRTKVHELLFDRFGEIGWGGNGGFHALNLAIQFGARKVVLLGFDMNLLRGAHWHGKHVGLNNPTQAGVDKWRERLDAQAPVLKRMGIEVVIGTPNSSLTAFPKLPLMEALR